MDEEIIINKIIKRKFLIENCFGLRSSVKFREIVEHSIKENLVILSNENLWFNKSSDPMYELLEIHVNKI